MTIEVLGDREWITLQEASSITGKRPSSLRAAIQRGKYDRVKKRRNKKGEYWLIHKDELANEIGDPDRGIDGSRSRGSEGDRDLEIAVEHGSHGHRQVTGGLSGDRVIVIPVEYYEQQQKERDNLMQGLLMYRYKFEEVDRQLKILPAPPEYVKAKIDELEKNLQEEARAKSLLAIEKAETEEEREQLRKDYEDFLSQLRAKLSEEERIKEELKAELEKAMADLKRPWWKKMFGIK